MNSTMLGNVRPFQATRVAVARPQRTTGLVVENRVALRFQRFGRKKLPFYRLVAIESKDRRNGEPLEYLGWYDPLKKETNLNAPALQKWLKNGAQPSDTVKALLQKAFVIPPKPVRVVVPKDAVKMP